MSSASQTSPLEPSPSLRSRRNFPRPASGGRAARWFSCCRRTPCRRSVQPSSREEGMPLLLHLLGSGGGLQELVADLGADLFAYGEQVVAHVALAHAQFRRHLRVGHALGGEIVEPE